MVVGSRQCLEFDLFGSGVLLGPRHAQLSVWPRYSKFGWGGTSSVFRWSSVLHDVSVCVCVCVCVSIESHQYE